MADNSTLPATNDVIRDLDRAGVKTQVVLLDVGGSSSEVICSASNPMPVSVTGTATVSGTVTANIGTSGSLALDATLTGGTQKTKLVDSAGTNVATVGAGGALKVDGSAVTQPVSGTFWQATQPVSLASVPSHAVTNAGTFATQATLQAGSNTVGGVNLAQYTPASGRLPVDGSGVTQPVSGTVTVQQATASSLKVDLSGTAANATAIKVDGSAVTQPVSNAGTFATQATLQAGTALVGKASVASDTSAIYSGTTALTPKFAKIAASSSGASTVVAAVTGKKIRVLALTLVATTAVTVKFQSHVTPTDLTGAMPFGANGGYSANFCPAGHFETVAGEALDINLGGAVAVAGHLTYVEV